MKIKTSRKYLTIIVILIVCFSTNAQLKITEAFQLIETAHHIEKPSDLIKELKTLSENDSLIIITFSKKPER